MVQSLDVAWLLCRSSALGFWAVIPHAFSSVFIFHVSFRISFKYAYADLSFLSVGAIKSSSLYVEVLRIRLLHLMITVMVLGI